MLHSYTCLLIFHYAAIYLFCQFFTLQLYCFGIYFYFALIEFYSGKYTSKNTHEHCILWCRELQKHMLYMRTGYDWLNYRDVTVFGLVWPKVKSLGACTSDKKFYQYLLLASANQLIGILLVS